jgi:hypothetical protein
MGSNSGKLTISADQVRQQLARILLDPLFRQSQRLCILLRFLVESTLAGRESELKEFVVGAEAFKRGAGFDPQVDNIVRVTAARLRSRLAEYYQSAGSREPIVITLPKGGYVPSFAAVETRGPASVQIPAAPVPGGTTIGRAAELDHLGTSFAAAMNGMSRIVAITGEAGIGKSTLTESFLSHLKTLNEPVWVLHGRCSERLSDTEPFLPIFECLEDLLQDKQGRDVNALMEQFAPAWLSQLEPLPERVDNELSAERFRRQFVRFLRALSELRPVVMSLDDLHWVDASLTSARISEICGSCWLFHTAHTLSSRRILSSRGSCLSSGKASVASFRRSRFPRGKSVCTSSVSFRKTDFRPNSSLPSMSGPKGIHFPCATCSGTLWTAESFRKAAVSGGLMAMSPNFGISFLPAPAT